MPEQLNDHQEEPETGFSSAESYKSLTTPDQKEVTSAPEKTEADESQKPFQFTRRDIETGEEIHPPANTNKIEAFEISEAFQGHDSKEQGPSNEFNIGFFRSAHSGYTEQLKQHPNNASLEAAATHSEIMTEGLLLTPEAKDKDTRLAIEMSKSNEPGSPILYEAYKAGTGGSHGNFLSMIETVEEGQKVTRSIEATGNNWDPVLYREIVYPEGAEPLVRVYKESSDINDLKAFTTKVLELSDPELVESHLSDSARIAELADARVTDQTIITLESDGQEKVDNASQKPSIVARVRQSIGHFANWANGPSSLQEAERN